MHPYADNFARLSRVPAVTISSIHGRARGAGSEFVLATDIRFAGDKAIFGQFEVGVGSVPAALRWHASLVWLGEDVRWRSWLGVMICAQLSQPTTLWRSCG
jgi:enoyl-CoA hydratase/carnithine racemase